FGIAPIAFRRLPLAYCYETKTESAKTGASARNRQRRQPEPALERAGRSLSWLGQPRAGRRPDCRPAVCGGRRAPPAVQAGRVCLHDLLAYPGAYGRPTAVRARATARQQGRLYPESFRDCRAAVPLVV